MAGGMRRGMGAPADRKIREIESGAEPLQAEVLDLVLFVKARNRREDSSRFFPMGRARFLACRVAQGPDRAGSPCG
jgi:hypothetical protein